MKLTTIQILDIKKFSQFLSKKQTYFLPFSLKISSTKDDFFLKNLRNLRPKIFEASKILRLLEMGRRRRRRWIFGQKSSKNEDLRSFVATLVTSSSQLYQEILQNMCGSQDCMPHGIIILTSVSHLLLILNSSLNIFIYLMKVNY